MPSPRITDTWLGPKPAVTLKFDSSVNSRSAVVRVAQVVIANVLTTGPRRTHPRFHASASVATTCRKARLARPRATSPISTELNASRLTPPRPCDTSRAAMPGTSRARNSSGWPARRQGRAKRISMASEPKTRRYLENSHGARLSVIRQ